jgi:hypothetical protein
MVSNRLVITKIAGHFAHNTPKLGVADKRDISGSFYWQSIAGDWCPIGGKY